jgi:hypothetical protein
VQSQCGFADGGARTQNEIYIQSWLQAHAHKTLPIRTGKNIMRAFPNVHDDAAITLPRCASPPPKSSIPISLMCRKALLRLGLRESAAIWTSIAVTTSDFLCCATARLACSRAPRYSVEYLSYSAVPAYPKPAGPPRKGVPLPPSGSLVIDTATQ